MNLDAGKLLRTLKFTFHIFLSFDPTIDSGNGNNCFQPKQPVDVGMAAGAAVGVTVFVIAAVAGAYFFYTKRNSLPAIGGITNPIA